MIVCCFFFSIFNNIVSILGMSDCLVTSFCLYISIICIVWVTSVTRKENYHSNWVTHCIIINQLTRFDHPSWYSIIGPPVTPTMFVITITNHFTLQILVLSELDQLVESFEPRTGQLSVWSCPTHTEFPSYSAQFLLTRCTHILAPGHLSQIMSY